MSTPILYTYGPSVWAAIPALAVAELYPSDAIEVRTVNLIKGENFSPEFLAKNPEGTIPTLEADGKAYTCTTDIIDYLVKASPIQVDAVNYPVVALLHEDRHDPNFIWAMARTKEELKEKAAGIPGLFISRRKAVLEKYAAADPSNKFYARKFVELSLTDSIFTGKASEDVVTDFLAKGNAHFEMLSAFLLGELPNSLPSTGFIGGNRPGSADFQVAGWLTHIAAVGGVKTGDDFDVLENWLGKPLPEKLKQYWKIWAARDSWKKVYASGPY